jgi:hypothetical protein
MRTILRYTAGSDAAAGGAAWRHPTDRGATMASVHRFMLAPALCDSAEG